MQKDADLVDLIRSLKILQKYKLLAKFGSEKAENKPFKEILLTSISMHFTPSQKSFVHACVMLLQIQSKNAYEYKVVYEYYESVHMNTYYVVVFIAQEV